MARLNLFFAAGLLWLAAMNFGGAARAANFTASLDRDTITLGESVTLSLAFEGGQPQSLPALPAIKNLQVQDYNNWSQNIQMDMNTGQSTAVFTHTMILRPQTTGEFVIPALSVDIGGQHRSSSPLKLTVTPAIVAPAAANSGNAVAFMKLSLPQKKIYIGQELTAQLQICLRDDVENFGNFQFTSQAADGFTINKMVQGQDGRIQIGGHAYRVIPLSVALTALKPGTSTLGPFTASLIVVLPAQNQGNDLVAQFFNRGEQKQISLATEQIRVECLPLPDNNKPANFNGAMASFTVTTSVGPTNLAVGDPVTVRVQVSGRGALDAVKLPEPLAVKDFKIFQSTATITNLDPLGTEGTKIFELVAAPQNADIREWPSLALTYSNSADYFNPEDGAYHTLASAAVPLAVRFAGSTPLPALPVNKNSAAENQTPQDILPLKENLGMLVAKSSPLVVQPVFLAVQAVPVLALVAAFVWRRRTDSLANNPRLRRQRAVAQIVRDGVADLEKFAAADKPDEFFATLFRLLQEQLGERLDCPASAITENVVEENSMLRASPETMRNDLRELFQLCNQARYAPVRGSSELNSVAAQFEKTIGELQEVKP